MKSIHSLLAAPFLPVFVCAVLIMTVPARVMAEAAGHDYCTNAQTTADLVTCKASQMRAESERLEKLYNVVREVYGDDDAMMTRIQNNQKAWISLRNDTCTIEGTRYKGGSLERVQELACLAAMTSSRLRHFESMLDGLDTQTLPAFSAPPRWINVLGHDYRDVFWAIASKQAVDTDCDSIDEIVIRGLRENKQGGFDTVIALVDSEPTGRPVISLLNFDDTKNCKILPAITVTPIPPVKPDGSVDLKQCKQQVGIRTENCGNFVIELDKQSDSYTLSAQTK